MDAKLIIHPNPALYKVCIPIKLDQDGLEEARRISVKLRLLMEKHKNALGLAATQMGVNKRLFVYKNQDTKKVCINPELLSKEGEVEESLEGCMSFPGVYIKIPRNKKIIFKYFDLDGVEHTEECTDLIARVVQHEIEHLDGHLFINGLSQTKKQIITGKMKKLQKAENKLKKHFK